MSEVTEKLQAAIEQTEKVEQVAARHKRASKSAISGAHQLGDEVRKLSKQLDERKVIE